MMKKLMCVATMAILILGGYAKASPITYDYTKDIYQVYDNFFWTGDPIEYEWEYLTSDNPYPGDYDVALAGGLIIGATITIVVDDLDVGNSASFEFRDKNGVWHSEDYYGNTMILNTMTFSDGFGMHTGPGNPASGHITTTTFALDPHWLNHTAVFGQLNWLFDDGGLNPNQLEIETATLSVIAIPEPATMALFGLGGLLLKKKREKS